MSVRLVKCLEDRCCRQPIGRGRLGDPGSGMLQCMVAEDATLWVRPLGDPGQHRRLGLDELATVYDALEIGPDSAFRWDGRSGDGAPSGSVIVFLVNDERCLVILRMQGEDHFLVEPGSDDDTTVIMRGARVVVPRSAVLPRRRGLEVLQAAGDLLHVRDNNAWRKVRCWRDDPLHERLGDLVEDLLDAVFELVLADPDGEPAGLRHCGNLMLLHNAVMSGGIGRFDGTGPSGSLKRPLPGQSTSD
jgi:hypothetical protein